MNVFFWEMRHNLPSDSTQTWTCMPAAHNIENWGQKKLEMFCNKRIFKDQPHLTFRYPRTRLRFGTTSRRTGERGIFTPRLQYKRNSNNLLMAWFVSSFTEICEPHLRLVVRPLFEICSLIVFTTLWFLQTIH